MRSSWLIIGVIVILAGCQQVVPMAEPAVLSATAGAPVVITQDRYQTQSFNTWYDATWTVVSSASFDEPHAYFISPAEDALILIAPITYHTDDIRPPALTPDVSLVQEMIVLGESFAIRLITTDQLIHIYQDIFQRMADDVVVGVGR